MVTLYQLLNVMDLDSELEIFDYDSIELLIEGRRGTIDLPHDLYGATVSHFIPGIVTKIFITDPYYNIGG